MDEQSEKMLEGLAPARMKTSELLLQHVLLSMRSARAGGPNYVLLNEKIREIAEEIDRRLPRV